MRKGDYRILYDIVDRQRIVYVIAIGHRKEIYER
ncbi:type II toxin-antitoxin system RelE family toxin [Leptospira yasudae]|nr:type II toxin-antitoxin system RelE/ParE family toxin [Leptospira yasudae]